MNKMEQLIQELCLDGVEYKFVSDICDITRGRVISKKYLRDNAGEYPVYSSQTANNGIFGFIDNYDYDCESITWTTDGANAGSVFYHSNERFSITNVCGLLRVIDHSIMNTKFLYYYLRIVAKDYVSSGMGNPKLMSNVMARVKIPLPPLPVQREIVRILDNFTELTAELTTELKARRKQYEYYRDLLLTFDDEVEWRMLSEISINTYSGGTPRANHPEYYGGDIPWLRTQEVRFVDIYDTEMRITPAALKNSAAKWIPKNCVIVAISGATAGRSAINKIPLTTNQHCCCLEINPEQANYRYVFHWISSQYEKIKSLGQGARSDLNSGIIKSFPIPIPPLEEQERIVSILDRFDALCNDLTSGLPAEIEARQKQYEYYRDKLLTFKEVTA